MLTSMLKVSGINEVNYKQSFQKKEKTEEKVSNPVKSNSKKVLLALSGLAVLGLATVAVIKKGGVKKMSDVKKISEISVDKFKSTGSFQKGKAILADGNGFSGTLTHVDRKGNKFAMEYIDGVLQESKKYSDDVFESVKEYTYNEKGLSSVKKLAQDHLDNFETVFTRNSDGSKLINRTITNGGKNVKISQNASNKLESIVEESYGSLQERIFEDGKVIERYKSKNYIETHVNIIDPKTKQIVEHYTEVPTASGKAIWIKWTRK